MVAIHLVSRLVSSNSWLFAGLLGLLLVLGTGCGEDSTATPKPTPTPAPFPLVIIDSNGLEVTFDRPPERIVSYDSAPIEMLFAMGEVGRIVGTHDFVTYPPEAEAIPKVGSAFNINQEKIVELEPDLIFTFYDGSLPDLENLGIKVLYLETPDTLEGISERIRLWGLIAGNPVAAEKIATEFDAKIMALQERLATVEEAPRVFHDGSDFWTPGPDTLVGRIYTLLKAQNIAGDISGYVQLSPEVILERDPQVIITTFPETLKVYQDGPAFQDVSAVKEGSVFTIDASLLEVAGPRFIEAVEELNRLIHPEISEQ